MRLILFIPAVLVMAILLQFCTSTKKVTATKAPAVTYDASIKPVIEANCAPCHIAGKGNKISLDNYTQASANADNIIERIQKNPGERGFMPAMHPKLSDSTISLFVQWKSSGLAEK